MLSLYKTHQFTFKITKILLPCEFEDSGLTPWKVNMEPTNHPCGKENDLTQTSMIMFQPLILRGVAPHLRILHPRKKPYRSPRVS